MLLKDAILMLLHANDKNPIKSILHLKAMLFLLQKNFDVHFDESDLKSEVGKVI